MYRLLFICLLISTTTGAQMQFWTKEDIFEKQFQQPRKDMGVKMAFNYVTSENWRVDDSTDHNEVFEYDKEGRMIVHKKYQRNWVKKTKYFQLIDSVFYNDKGILMGMYRYGPKLDGQYYEKEFAAKTTLNAKGQIARMDFYRGYQASELDNYYIYTYDAMGKVTIVSSYDPQKKKTNEWKLTYDKAGRVIKVRAIFYSGKTSDFTDYIIKYNADGLLTNYIELYKGTEKRGENKYLYDDQRRLFRQDYVTTSNYSDSTGYWYTGTQKVFGYTYLKYPRPSGHETDFAHEFRVYKFEYYKP